MEGLNLGSGKKITLILQTEAAECGLACLAMVASFHGFRTDLPHLRQTYSVSLKGMNLARLMQIAAKMNLATRPMRVDIQNLARLNLPTILHWNLDHFVVLQRVKNGKATIYDPAQGICELPLVEVSKHFTGVALELEPTLQFQRRTERQSIQLRGLMGRVRGLNTSLFQVLLLAFSLEVFTLIGPFLTQWIVDDALVSGDRDLITVIVIGILLLGISQTAVNLLRSWVLLYMGTSLNTQWVANVIRHLLRLPVAFFERRNMGDILSRFNAISAIQQTLTTSFIAAILDGMMAVTTLVMMFIYNRTLGAIALGAVVLYGVLRLMRYDALRMASEGQIVLAARQQTHFMETIRGIQTIKLFNRQADRQARYLKLTVDSANTAIKVQRMNLTFQGVNGLLVAVEGVLVLWLGSRAVLEGGFTIGMLMAFIAYKDQFTQRISSLIDKSIELRMLRLQAERLSDIVLSRPEADLAQPSFAADAIVASLSLRDVCFRYAEGEPWVLENVNMTIEAGESVALVGPSGCGKTTLLKIMLGLIEPTEGEVLIGGVPLKQVGASHYRSLIGAVMQDDRLFAGSLADNISFFDTAADQAHVEACARLACIHDAIMKMPMGYHSLVGDMGSGLSGGQQQRIVLARALYKRPSLLFLDEATSHLDIQLEKQIATAIADMALTRIVVAHRPETIRASGRVIELQAPRPGRRRADALPPTITPPISVNDNLISAPMQ